MIWFSKLWIRFKIWVKLLFNRKGKIKKEMLAVKRFIKENKIKTVFNIMNYLDYIPEKIDWQKLAYETIKDKGGDCEDIHRVVQIIIYLLTHNTEVFLIQALVKPAKLSHAFVIYKNTGTWKAVNYGERFIGKTKEEVIYKVLDSIGVKQLIWYYATNLNWERAF